MTLNPITWVRQWLKRREQEKIDAECYRRMVSQVGELHRWCGSEFPIIMDVTNWLLRANLRRRGVDPKPEYVTTDGYTYVDTFREYLRDTHFRRVYNHEGKGRWEPPRCGSKVGTYSPTEVPVELIQPSDKPCSRLSPPNTPFKE